MKSYRYNASYNLELLNDGSNGLPTEVYTKYGNEILAYYHKECRYFLLNKWYAKWIIIGYEHEKTIYECSFKEFKSIYGSFFLCSFNFIKHIKCKKLYEKIRK